MIANCYVKLLTQPSAVWVWRLTSTSWRGQRKAAENSKNEQQTEN